MPERRHPTRPVFPLFSAVVAALVLVGANAEAAKRKPKRSRGPSPAETTAAPPVETPPMESEPSAPPLPTNPPSAPASSASVAQTPEPSIPSRKSPARRLDRRLVVAADFFFEKGRLNGTQTINGSARDEGFKYGRGFLSGSAWLLFPESSRFRWGPGLRILGRYSASIENQEPFELGFLTQAFVAGEFSLPLASKFDLLLGGRAGFGLLVPGGDFKAEINRLRAQGVGVWGVPRVGWLAGLNAGTRWAFSKRVALRGDLNYGLEQLFLFATHQNVDGLSFAKTWSTYTMRFGLTVGLEVSF